MSLIEGISPIVPVSDLEASVAFYRDILEFEVRTYAPENRFALVAREGAAVSLLGGADEAALTATRNQISAYIWVADLDALWTALEDRLAALPEDRVRAPFDQLYGMREFHVKDPDGFLMFFGQAIDVAS